MAIQGLRNSLDTSIQSNNNNNFGTLQSDILTNFNPQAYRFSYLKIIFVITLFLISLITFVTQTELTSLLYSKYQFNEPILLLYLTHGSWWILWPLQFLSIALYKTIKRYILYKKGFIDSNGKRWKGFRKTFTSSIKAQHQNIFHTIELTTLANISDYEILYKDPKKSFNYYSEFIKSKAFNYIFKMSALLCIILNIAGLTWYVAMSLSTGSDVTAIYNCSAFTAYIFAIPILKEKFSWIKANSVIIAIIGVFMVAYMGKLSNNNIIDSNNDFPHRLLGNFIILFGAILYGLYEVFYKKWCCPPSEIVSARRQATFSNFIMCLIGINTFIVLGLAFLIVEILNIHHFQFPTDSTAIFVMIASILSNILFSVSFLGLMSLTSPVLSSVASLLTILVVGLFEYIFRGIVIEFAQIIGYVLIILGFTLLTYASWNEITQEDTEDDYITDTESTYSISSSQIT
jgi:drug/metabolite transporter (DMT)-like permease